MSRASNTESLFTQKPKFQWTVIPPLKIRKADDFIEAKSRLTQEEAKKQGITMAQKEIFFLKKKPLSEEKLDKKELDTIWVRKTYTQDPKNKDNPKTSDNHEFDAYAEAFYLFLHHIIDPNQPRVELYKKDDTTTYLHCEYIEGKDFPDYAADGTTPNEDELEIFMKNIAIGSISNYGQVLMYFLLTMQIDAKGVNLKYIVDPNNPEQFILKSFDGGCSFLEGYSFPPNDKIAPFKESYVISPEVLSLLPDCPLTKPGFNFFNLACLVLTGQHINKMITRKLKESRVICHQVYFGMLQILLLPSSFMMNISAFLTLDNQTSKYKSWGNEIFFTTLHERRAMFFEAAKKTERMNGKERVKTQLKNLWLTFADYLHGAEVQNDFQTIVNTTKQSLEVYGGSLIQLEAEMKDRFANLKELMKPYCKVKHSETPSVASKKVLVSAEREPAQERKVDITTAAPASSTQPPQSALFVATKKSLPEPQTTKNGGSLKEKDKNETGSSCCLQ